MTSSDLNCYLLNSVFEDYYPWLTGNFKDKNDTCPGDLEVEPISRRAISPIQVSDLAPC